MTHRSTITCYLVSRKTCHTHAAGNGLSHTLYPPGIVHTLRLRALGEVGFGGGFLPQLSK